MDAVGPQLYHFLQGRVWPQMASTYNIAAKPNTTCIVIIMPSYGTFTCTLYLPVVLNIFNFLITPYDIFFIRISYSEFSHGSSWYRTEGVIYHAFFGHTRHCMSFSFYN
jgi:hypothetical protein